MIVLPAWRIHFHFYHFPPRVCLPQAGVIQTAYCTAPIPCKPAIRPDWRIGNFLECTHLVPRNDLGNDGQESLLGELPQIFAEVAGKETIEVAADKAGFGNKETYRQAKTVVEKAEPELVAAMDSGKVAISTAGLAQLDRATSCATLRHFANCGVRNAVRNFQFCLAVRCRNLSKK